MSPDMIEAWVKDGKWTPIGCDPHASWESRFCGFEAGWNAALASRDAQQGVPEGWRCFHCDATFTDRIAAREHFGASEVAVPACHISPRHYRQIEDVLGRWVAQGGSDAEEAQARMDADRESKHRAALRHEEERGYAKGLVDGRAKAPPPPTAQPSREGQDDIVGYATNGRPITRDEVYRAPEQPVSEQPASYVSSSDRFDIEGTVDAALAIYERSGYQLMGAARAGLIDAFREVSRGARLATPAVELPPLPSTRQRMRWLEHVGVTDDVARAYVCSEMDRIEREAATRPSPDDQFAAGMEEARLLRRLVAAHDAPRRGPNEVAELNDAWADARAAIAKRTAAPNEPT